MIRVMVVDDAPFIREIVRHVIEGSLHSLVAEAQDGIEAIELARKHRPDVILMDIVMPKKTGIEATKQILFEFPQTKIIAFSTADQETMVLNAIDAGCCSFLTKPFKKDELLAMIERSYRESTQFRQAGG